MAERIIQYRLIESFRRFKENIAIESSAGTVTYRDLDVRSNMIARWLLDKGIKKESFIGVLMNDKVGLITIMIGILKAGCVFIPWDTTFPTNRLARMIKSTGTKYIFCDSENAARYAAALSGNMDIEWILYPDTFLNGTAGKDTGTLPHRLEIKYSPQDHVYIYFTSGSTGTPRAMIGVNKSLCHFIDWEIETFGINRDSRFSQFINPAFDAFLRDVLTPLSSGGRICIPGGKEILLDPTRLIDWVENSGICLIHCTPSLFKVLNSEELTGDHFQNLKYILLSGEKIEPSYLVNWHKTFGERIKPVNLWGTSETTLAKTYYFIGRPDADKERIPVGRPIKGAQVVVLAKDMSICEENVVGEVYIRTPFMTSGYIDDPELNQQRFIQNPFNNKPGDLMHKTGDLGKILPDGNLDISGRVDRQVKVRGIRVELEEIESTMLKYPAVTEAVVIKKGTTVENELLYGFVTGNFPPPPDEETFNAQLKEFLSGRLPDYMVPTRIVIIGKIPRTSRGKVDYEPLLELVHRETLDYEAPHDETQDQLAQLWMKILGIKKVGINTSFFEFGGNSLNIMTLITKIHQKFDVKISLAEIFNNLTVKQQAEIIKSAKSDKFLSIKKCEEKEYYSLSPAQKRLYILHQANQRDIAYNNPMFMTMTGEPEKEKLGEIFKKLIQRHESLRTSFEVIADRPVQRIKKYPEIHFEIEYDDLQATLQATGAGDRGRCKREPGGQVLDACSRHDPGSRELRAKSRIHSFIRPFDLRHTPLLRVGLKKIEETKHLFMFDMHHIITDGTSQEIFTKEFMILYENGRLSPLKFQYKDFSQWQNRLLQSDEIKKQENYWMKEFAEKPPILNLPADYPRPKYQSFEGKALGFGLGVEETARLKGLADAKEVTLYTLLLTVFNVMLSRLTGQETIVIGTVIAGRRHADLHDIIGMFVNTLALKQYPAGDKTCTGFLEEVKHKTLEAFENQDYPFEDLVEKLKLNRDLSRNPLFDVMFVFQNYKVPAVAMPEPVEISKLNINNYQEESTTAKFDLGLVGNERGEDLDFAFEYCSKLFKEETIRRFIRCYRAALQCLGKNPGIKISQVEILSEEEKKQLLVDFNNTRSNYPGTMTLAELFAEQMKKTPDKIVVVSREAVFFHPQTNEPGMISLTYRELDRQSNHLVRLLHEKGSVAGEIVGLLVEPSINMPAGMLAILKAGGAYLPISSRYPAKRIDYLLTDSGARFLLTTTDAMAVVGGIFTGVQPIFIDRLIQPAQPAPNHRPHWQPPHLVYVIYTSGSTGKPKGVLVEHRNVVRLVKNTNIIDAGPDDRLLLTGILSFDISTFEIWYPLLNGVTLFLTDQQVILEAEPLGKLIVNNHISILHLTPQLFNRLASQRLQIFAGLKYFMVGGDLVHPVHINRLRKTYPHIKILHMYGPTENTTFSTFFPVNENYETHIPIGRPISNSTVYIVDKYCRLAPPGAVGELCVGGDGVARGYLNRPGLTAEKFINAVIRHSSLVIRSARLSAHDRYPMTIDRTPKLSTNDRLYRTGDLARWLADGNIEFLGRSDHQVKIRGFRVEPGEIESQLVDHDKIKEAVVVINERPNQDKYLCAYLVTESGGEINPTGLKNFLSGRLPAYMIPVYFIPVDKIPLTPSGKLDREALPKPGIKAAAHDNAPGDEIEKKLAEMWADLLTIDKCSIGLDANFFDLGGHSLNAIVFLARLHREFDVNLQLLDIFATPVLKNLAGLLKTGVKKRFASIEPAEKREYYPLSSAQKRLYFLQQLVAGSTLYNMTENFEMMGKPGKEQLEKIFRQLLNRHESLRTSFRLLGGEPVQEIHDQVEFEIEYYNASQVKAKVEVEEEAAPPVEITKSKMQTTSKKERTAAAQNHDPESREPRTNSDIENFIRPFDLSRAPLLRVGLIETEENKSNLLVDMHHIISDGTSHNILARDFKALFTGEALSPLRVGYKDFSQWQNSSDIKKNIKRQAAYWLEQFREESPVLNIPTDYPRPVIRSFEGNWIVFEIPPHQVRALKTLASNENASLFMVLLTVYNILQSKLSNQEDIVVGIPMAGRRHADLEQVIGMFVNTLPLRNFPRQYKAFKEFLREVKKQTLKAFENQEYPFEDLVENVAVKRDASRNPLFDVILSLQNKENQAAIDRAETLPLGLKAGEVEANNSKYDLILDGQEVGNKLIFAFSYCTKLFKKETIARFIGYLKSIVSFILESPDAKIADIEILTAEEKQRVLFEFNNTAAEYTKNKPFHHLFSEQAKRTPDHIAVAGQVAGRGGHNVNEPCTLTYKELNEKSRQLARVLSAKGVYADKVVGIMVDHSVEMLVGLMGILKAGGAFLPIDPRLPQDRVRYMLNDSRAPIVLTKTDIMEKHSYTAIQDRQRLEPGVLVTGRRPQVTDLDHLPLPDRSLVDYDKYSRHIGLTMFSHTLSIQASRGCPYNCAYCHKIWPKTHIVRSAQNIFTEVLFFYNLGVRRFAFVDDIFNLDKENSTRFFELIIENKIDIQLFFPNGFRGDILTKEYIDLAVKAGTVNIALSLETASPRLQKLIRKNINLEKLEENIKYICETYPHVILELQTMHGFPTETKEEAGKTLDFMKRIKWIHFPYLHILKIYPNTDMADLAIKNGVSPKAIERSAHLAYHDLPDTLPFEKEFTLKFQAKFLNEYFLSRERLLHVLPYQLKLLTKEELVQKYDSYLPASINCFEDLLQFIGITEEELGPGGAGDTGKNYIYEPGIKERMKACYPPREMPGPDAMRILLLDLSQFFSSADDMLYDVVEPPLGLLYILTYLHRHFPGKVHGRIAKSRIDFDNYNQLKTLLEEFNPDVIGIRSLTFYKDFMHKIVCLIRQWGYEVPVIAGGPYATSSSQTILSDTNIDLLVLGEGEITFARVIEQIMANQGKLPLEKTLKDIAGIAFVPRESRLKPGDTSEIIMIDHLDAPGDNGTRENFAPVTRARDLAYVIYTSGSTGTPNGVMIEHQALLNLCYWHRDYYSVSSADRASKYAGFGFDASVWEIFPYLLVGASLFIPGDEIKLDMQKLSGYFTNHRVNISFLPTQVGEQFMKFGNHGLEKLLVGGDKLRVFTNPGYPVYNNYGPTENTVVATACRVHQDSGNIPIGKPIANNRIYILNKHNKQLQPVGLFGELCISGGSLARGYSNNPGKTREKFVNNPWEKGERMFKTGDLARWLPDGNIEFLGRIDQQVKVRGYRIELAEIEQHLLKFEKIKEAVVIEKENEEKEKYLSAYIVSNKTFEIAELKDFLSKTLPDYMVPSYFWRIEHMPLTPNGKLDRKALMKSAEKIDVDEYIAPGNEMEKIVAAAWQEALGRYRVGRNDNFFELGGTSLDIIRLSNRFKEIFAKDIPVVVMFRYPTVRSFAGYLNREHQEDGEVKVRAEVLDKGKISRTQRLQKRKEMR